MQTLLPLVAILLALVSSAQSATSAHYGFAGESWKPTGPLSDWSFAGYAGGAKSIPSLSTVANVRDYGAVGNGVTDDTNAIQQALAVAMERQGAVYIPAGTYVLTKKLKINSSTVAIRGAGKGATKLYLPYSLQDVYGPKQEIDLATGKTKSLYSYNEGFIEIRGGENKQKLANVVGAALRGDRRLFVSSTRYFQVGNWVRLFMSDPDKSLPNTGSLFTYLYDGQPGTIGAMKGKRDVIRFSSRIAFVGENYVDLERPLAHDVRLEWRPQLHSLTNSVQNVGLESLTIEFKSVPYAGHQVEPGYNAIYIRNAMNLWVKDIAVLNCDNGVIMVETDFTTVSGVTIGITQDRSGLKKVQGHHSIKCRTCTEVDVYGFDIQANWDHDCLAEFYSFNVVYRDGKGVDITIDLHRGGPHAILYSNIDMGAATRPYDTESGGESRGRHSASWTTFWNLRRSSGAALPLPPCDYGAKMNFIGNFAGDYCSASRWIVEPAVPTMDPINLYKSMVSTQSDRLQGNGGVAPIVSEGKYQLRAYQNKTHPYLAADSNGGVFMSTTPVVWERFKHSSGSTLFTTGNKWLSRDGSTCQRLKTFGTYDSELRYFGVRYVSGSSSPSRYHLTTQCTSSTTGYATARGRLSTSTTDRASWVFEAPGTKPPSPPPPPPAVAPGFIASGTYALKTPQNKTYPYLSQNTDGSLKMSSKKFLWNRYKNADNKYIFGAKGRYLSNNGNGCSSILTYLTANSVNRHFKLISLANTSPQQYFMTTGCRPSTTTYTTSNRRLTTDKAKRNSWILEI